MISNIGLCATSEAVLTEFLSLEDIAYSSIEDLVAFIKDKGKNRFSNPTETAKLLKKAANDSYRLDKVLYEPLNISIASSTGVDLIFGQQSKNQAYKFTRC